MHQLIHRFVTVQFITTVLIASLVPAFADSAERRFTIANLEYEGTKVFVPSTLIVRQGDRVRIRVVNQIPSDPNQHGFAIPDFDVQEVVTRGEPVEVKLEVSKTGLFPIKCHLHAAHVGGQLLVLPPEE